MKTSNGSLSRRRLFKKGAAAAAGATLLSSGSTLMGQAPAVVTARTFRAWISRGTGRGRTTLQDVRLRHVAPVQVTDDGGASWNPSASAPVATSTTEVYAAQLAVTAEAEMGATATTFLDSGAGWIAVERGVCSGAKLAGTTPAEEAIAAEQPFDCIQYNALLSTADGGNTWIDITPPSN